MSALVVGCVWTVYANVFAASIYPSVGVVEYVPPAPLRHVERLSFAARFAPLADAAKSGPVVLAAKASDLAKLGKQLAAKASAVTIKTAAVIAAPAESKQKNQYFALMDSNYSLGMAPDSFRQPEALAAAPSAVAEASPQAASTKIASNNVAATKIAPTKVASAKEAAPKPAAPKTAPVQLALNVPVPPARPSLARLPETPRAPRHTALVERAKAAIMASAAARKSSIFEKLFGGSDNEAPGLAYASADGDLTGSARSGAFTASPDDRVTAVYDISAATVYMPDGSKLEAHSGLGDKLDNPRYVKVRMRGATPPHIYNLKMRESLFHGVAAIRLNPVGGDQVIFGRNGLLAHTYMLGPRGDSNGCISFKDYNKFLQAFRRGEIKKLVVVGSLNDA
ncbi:MULTISPECIES: DUF2778 domain-containing protein [Rhodopseudomonas]|uniref:DUF2778 domain-containing protein n=1 Tax=Rhodopseudomonas TaxID=1073 RepID=UPI001F2AF0D2|nr:MULTISPECIES: DUF2778 domain-containing protein [Rhodopseudomonas]MDF3813810.1 DUF2778 domain-containing protein [Rhodopseudomonas sp. BAL398]WOK19671.1 DUF2778 domain-containing protein [Rhodopseudomonas sp. BAL398]